ncbi:MAG: hypothetical protein FJW96_10445 [Actinobacteria bacterium]|nr:hypothetical protein [Actinomycetota bacterium]
MDDDDATQVISKPCSTSAACSPTSTVSASMTGSQTMTKRKWKTPEESAAERAYREDLDRRPLAMIEKYRKAQRGVAGGLTRPSAS